MTLKELIQRLNSIDVSLSVADGVLGCTSVKGALTDRDKQALRQHKTEILTLLNRQTRAERISIKKSNSQRVKAGHRMRDWWRVEMDKGRNYLAIPAEATFEIALDPEQIEKAIFDLQLRHPILRSVFSWDSEALWLNILERLNPQISYHDISHVQDQQDSLSLLVEEYMNFDVVMSGKPVHKLDRPPYHIAAIKTGESSFKLIFFLDHLIADVISMNILVADTIKLMSNDSDSELIDLEVNLTDYLDWQSSQYPETSQWQAGEAYWQSLYQGADCARIEHQYKPTSSSQSSTVGSVMYLLPPNLSAALIAFSKRERKSLACCLFALTAKCAGKMAGVNNPTLGNVLAGRETAGLENVLCNFADMYFIPVKGVSDNDFLSLVEQVTDAIRLVNLYQHHNHRSHIPDGFSSGVLGDKYIESSSFAFGMEPESMLPLVYLEDSVPGELLETESEFSIPFDWLGMRFSEQSGYIVCRINYKKQHYPKAFIANIYDNFIGCVQEVFEPQKCLDSLVN